MRLAPPRPDASRGLGARERGSRERDEVLISGPPEAGALAARHGFVRNARYEWSATGRPMPESSDSMDGEEEGEGGEDVGVKDARAHTHNNTHTPH